MVDKDSSSYHEGYQDGYAFEDSQYGHAIARSAGIGVSPPHRDHDSDYNQGVSDGRQARKDEGR